MKSRVGMVERLIELAATCMQNNNYSSTFAIVSGLETSAVFRMKKTWEAVAPEKRELLSDMVTVLSSSKSFKGYRARLHK
jgi:hypothetical protein